MGNWRLRVVLFCIAALMAAQTPDPAFAPLDRAYKALAAKDYDRAIAEFQEGIALAPNRPDVRKDFGYTLLKAGQSEAARYQFAEAMRLRPDDQQTALEYAYLCYETRQPVEARRTFDRLRKAGNAMAQQAFDNIDRPLREGIARWQEALRLDPQNFSAHEELARLAEQRDELALAAQHYEAAWRLRTDRRDLLIDLARIWKQLDRTDDATAALIAAWRGGTPRDSEAARELLPARYPYLSEFERALRLDPTNAQLRQDVEFQKSGAVPEPQSPQLSERPSVPVAATGSSDSKSLGMASFEKGYLKDAVKYLQAANEEDPVDFDVMLKLGWSYNMLKDDRDALHWFDLARRSPDPSVASEASRAYHNLTPALERFKTTVWAFPIFSSRWNDVFAYAQAKTEMRLASVPLLRPYVSVRLLGDAKGTLDTGFGAQYLSERSVIFAAGLATVPRHGLTGWFEAGEALIYREAPGQDQRTRPDYRGGVSYAKGFGHLLGSHGWFTETNEDGIFVSRFSNDSLLYSQNRAGYSFGNFQALWNANVTADAKRQYWANFAETGPGLRFRPGESPLTFSVNFLRGAYLINQSNPRRPNYNEVRIGVWYAFTH